jgi:polyisoprenoid-binding protein YceI
MKKPLLHCLIAIMPFALLGSAQSATLEVDARRSKIEVAVTSTVHDFEGELTNYQASIEWSPQDRLPAKTDLLFDFKDLKTGSQARDKEMLKWLKYSINPKAAFHLTGWKQDGTDAIALGDLTIHEVKKAIQIPVLVKKDGDDYDLTGAVGLDYRDFNLPVIRKALLFSVDPHLKVTFHLKGKLIPAK